MLTLVALVTAASSSAGWLYFAVINPTIGAAVVAAVASLSQTLILLRHERRVDRRFDERRMVVTRGENAVTISDEERRELERDRRELRHPRHRRNQ